MFAYHSKFATFSKNSSKFVYLHCMMPNSLTYSPPSKRIRYNMPGESHLHTTMPVPTNKSVLQIAKLTQDAIIPTRGSAQSAGLDLYSSEEAWIPALGKFLVKTGLSIALPDGCYGRVAPRSGLSSKHFVDVGAGVIDQDYRGEVKVLLFNFNRVDYHGTFRD
ncbi:uncharacterized protein [Apostichopus japonicus]|uniref:uncharacterized protein isoform X2 n=1 Tax=Stichopus japonicus TaxID=307972 RepID=UPI003AB2FAAB